MERLREALRADRALAQAWFRLRAGDPEGSVLEAKQLVRTKRKDPDVHHLLGIAAAAAGKEALAVRALRKSQRLRPDGWVLVHLVNVLLERGRIGAARRLVADARRKGLGGVRAGRAAIYVQIAAGDFEAARAGLEALLQEGNDASLQYQLAVVLLELERPREARDALWSAVRSAPMKGDYRKALFDLLTQAKDWAGLVEAGSGAGAGTAGPGVASFFRGVGLMRQDRSEEAIRAFSEVAEHGEPEILPAVGAAGYLLQLGAWAPAEAGARKALVLRPSDPAIHHLLALILSRLGRESEALAHYRRAAEEDKEEAAYRHDLGLSLCGLERLEELEELLIRAAKDFPEDTRFPSLGARCLPAAP